MKLRTIEQVSAFLATVDSCDGNVWLQTKDGNKLNLKSKLFQYVAISALLKDEDEVLELFCALKEDEQKFLQYFTEHPGVN